MTANLMPCPSCSRHVRAPALSCPFCAAKTDEPKTKARVLAARSILGTTSAAVTLGLALSACYGGPPVADRVPPQTPAAATSDAGTADPSSQSPH